MEKELNRFHAFAAKGGKQERANRKGAVIYTRVSTKEQADNNASLTTQKKYCELFAKRRELNIIQYFGGTHESAKSDERVEFQKMLKYVKSHTDIAYIIVYSYDRFSRTGTNGSYITEQLKKQGILVCSATQEVDATTSAGSLQQDMFFIFSKFDNDIRRDKSVSGMREKLRNGYITGSVPFGYTNMNPGKGKLPNLQINKDGELLREAFLLKANHDLTYQQICDRLKSRGWSKHQKKLSELFRNPFYCGIIVSSLIPGEVIRKERYPAIISEDLFLQVNGIIEKKRTKGQKYNRDEENLPLKQFIRAESCGTHYTGYLVKKKGLYYYKNNRRGSKENKSAKVMHEMFKDLLSHFELSDNRLIEPLKDALIQMCIEQHAESMEQATALEGHLTKIENQIETIEKRFVLGEISPELFNKYKGQFDTELIQIKDELQNSTFKLSNLENAVDKAINYALNLPSLWESADLEEKRRIQKMVFPEGLVFDFENNRYRTPRINGLFVEIALKSRDTDPKKKGTVDIINLLSPSVLGAGLEPARPNEHRILSPACLPIPPSEQLHH
jgi:site-specific DNA recombinase